MQWISGSDQVRNPRAWISLILGLVLVGAGVGMMLDAGFGVSPGDVFFSGVAHITGLSVGTIMVISYFVMVAGTWPVGIRPGPGTLACILLIGPAVDVMRLVDTAIGVPTWGTAALVGWWITGMLVFAIGVVGLFGAHLGVSPYDQVTLAVAKVTGRTLGVARFITDGSFLIVGVLLGGSWGWGTVVLLVVLPVALNRVLPRARRLITGTAPVPS